MEKRPEENTEREYTINSDINFDAVPQEVKDRLSAATLAAVRKFLTQPGADEILRRGYEAFEKRRKRYEAAKQKENAHENRTQPTRAGN